MRVSAPPDSFPFTAIVGQDAVRLALTLVAINRRVGGVVLRGERGTAKSTLARGLAAVLGSAPFRTLSLGATEDRVVGGTDLEQTLMQGRPVFAPGLLADVHGGILYIDEVNLLDDHLVDVVLDAAASGVNTFEREGLSATHPSVFSLIGTMNPEEGALRPQLLDRFGLAVDVVGEVDPEMRAEIMGRNREFAADRQAFLRRWAPSQQAYAERLQTARERLSAVRVPRAVLELGVAICRQAGVAGHRADLVLTEAARALAAWRGRSSATDDDVLDVVEFVLLHRRRDHVPHPPASPPPPPPAPDSADEPTPEHAGEGPDDGDAAPDHDEDASDAPHQQPPPEAEPTSDDDLVAGLGEPFKVQQVHINKDRVARSGSGGRQTTRSSDRRGRYVSAISTDQPFDLALDAMVRAAAPHQTERRARARREGDARADLAILIERSDWRAKKRVTKISSAVLFLVDASGSMGARGRMVASKTAILSLLLDAYVKRDRVAMITFRGDQAHTVLPPTASVDLADRKLRELPVGGRTPLAAGLIEAQQNLSTLLAKDPSLRPLVVLITDGRANVDLDGAVSRKAFTTAVHIARRLGDDRRVTWIVVDTEEPRGLKLGKADELATALNAPLYTLDNLRAEDLINLARNHSTMTLGQ
ncbi:MAG: VWA domain-containing protein [Propionibacteriaceae bacterium]|nr:VWA domain-containing protein [Propionibacteriaceae bacterium]